ncbi:MAG: helix-hairpin-helix domain-containing protein [Anaerolineales bacterium]|nr:helix-hairpin-helix domain-containing protein [Anaerolineales bacterium]
MSDFLTFLNTADLDTLTQAQGITHSVAENIIAARPFNTIEDCLKVKGMGKTLLARLQSIAEAKDNDPENRALIPVEEEAPPAYVEKSQQPAQEKVEEQDSFLTRLGRAFINFLRALLRLIILVIFLGGIGALLYYGLPYINRTFIAPVERNTAQINKLEAEVSSLQTQLDEMNARVTALETSVEGYSASIQKLQEMQAELDSQLQKNNDKILLDLKHEVMMTRALDILARARLYLAQSNFGLAKIDVQSARDLLAELQAETNDDLLLIVLSRLDLTLGNLPDFPVVAAGDLEIAWQILMSGNAPVIPTVTFTPTPATLETSTPTPLPPPAIISATPTP